MEVIFIRKVLSLGLSLLLVLSLVGCKPDHNEVESSEAPTSSTSYVGGIVEDTTDYPPDMSVVDQAEDHDYASGYYDPSTSDIEVIE